MEGARQATTSQLCLEVFTKRPHVLPSNAPIRVPSGYGISGNTQPRCPSPLQWFDPLPLVWEGGPEWGNSCQPAADSALQAQPGVQQMLWLPINLIRHSLPPKPEELSTPQRRRPQWVSFIRVIIRWGQGELICLKWESEWRSPGELASLRLLYWGHLPPIGTALEEKQMEKVPPANPQCPITCFLTNLDQVATCYSWITQEVCQQCWTLWT